MRTTLRAIWGIKLLAFSERHCRGYCGPFEIGRPAGRRSGELCFLGSHCRPTCQGGSFSLLIRSGGWSGRAYMRAPRD